MTHNDEDQKQTESGQAPVADIGARVAERAEEAAAFLKALAHGGRLTILCHLAGGERSVSDLERLLDSRQAAVSQQLARLRLQGLVETRREGKTIFYRLHDPSTERLIKLIHELFCGEDA